METERELRETLRSFRVEMMADNEVIDFDAKVFNCDGYEITECQWIEEMIADIVEGRGE